MTQALYDRIGVGYANYRRPDQRIAIQIANALKPARTVVNVGAGSGSYEPPDLRLVAAEPSARMIAQRAAGSAPAVVAVADRLPFRDASFDGALAILTMHHWPDWRAGLKEMRRVARDRVVLFTWDPADAGFWLVRDYFPEIIDFDRTIFPSLQELEEVLGPVESRPVMVPADCIDGFLGAYWRRPEMYFDVRARRAISSFWRIEMDDGLARLRADLDDGSWAARNPDLQHLAELDAGYRVIVASC